MNLGVRAGDERRLEVLASGVACFGGAQLAVDATLRSPVMGDGSPRPRADWMDGATTEEAMIEKRRRCPELANGARCRLVVVGIETGGRFGHETVEFLRQLAIARSQTAPKLLRGAAALAMERRWSRLLACTAARIGAASLRLDKQSLRVASAAGPKRREPWLADVLADARRDLVARV